MANKLEIRVFISSPGDVEQERVIASRVLKRLNEQYSRFAKVEGVFWEHEPLRATDSFQAQITPPSQTDIAVCILWSRLGTRLPEGITRDDGSRYDSGTEFEFEDAFLSQQSKGIPDLLVYRKTKEPLVSLTDEDRLLESMRQKKALDKFIQKWFHAEDGSLVAAFHPFDTAAKFEDLLEVHLRKLIEIRIKESGHMTDSGKISGIAPKPRWEGSPYRGLEVFREEHSEIFFGRTKAIGDIIEKLKRLEIKKLPFLVVLGMSGSGKSSVVSAGVVPMITQPGVIEGISLWKTGKMRPASMGGDLIGALVNAVVSETALPGLLYNGETIGGLIKTLKENPAVFVSNVKSVLRQNSVVEAERSVSNLKQDEAESDVDFLKRQNMARTTVLESRLLLMVDQFEEIFTHESITSEDRELFTATLTSLSETGLVWIIATLRSDFYAQALSLKSLKPLHGLDGQYNLLPPEAHEIGQMIRLPAFSAGLKFEENFDTGLSLDDQIREAAAQESGSLPLLQFTLSELYKARSDKNLLTFRAYSELGGLEGALARTAEDAFLALSKEAQNSFSSVFRALVSVSSSGERITKKIALTQNLSKTPGASELCSAFVERRLFVADNDEKGRSTISIAHEALLSAWPRLGDWLENDQELLRVYTRVLNASKNWVDAGRNPQLLLNTGKPLEEAMELQSESGVTLSSDELSFLQDSQNRANKTKRLKRAALSSLVVLTIFAGGAALFANSQRLVAKDNETLAQKNEQLAVKNEESARKATKIAQESNALSQKRLARVLSLEGQRALDSSDFERAALYSGAAWQSEKNATNEFVLSTAMDKLEKKQPAFKLADNSSALTAFSPDGLYAAVVQSDTLTRWSLARNKKLSESKIHDGPTNSVKFSDDGRFILTIGVDNTVFLTPVDASQAGVRFKGHRGYIISALLSSDSSQLITGSLDGTTRVWDTTTGEELEKFSASDGRDVSAIALSKDSRYVLIGSSDGRLRRWSILPDSPEASKVKECPSGDIALVEIVTAPKGDEFYTLDAQKVLRRHEMSCSNERPPQIQLADDTISQISIVDNKVLIIGDDRHVSYFDGDTLSLETEFTIGGAKALAMSDSGRSALVSKLNTLEVVDGRSGRIIEAFENLQGTPVRMSFTQNENAAFVVMDDQYANLIRLGSKPLYKDYDVGKPFKISQLNSLGNSVIAYHGNYSLSKISLATGQAELFQIPQSCGKDVSQIIAFNDMDRFAVQSQNCISIFDEGVLSGPLKNHKVDNEINSLGIDRTDNLYFSTSKKWGHIDSDSLEISRMVEMPAKRTISKLEVMPEGNYVVILERDKDVSIWYTQTGKERFTLESSISNFEIAQDSKIAFGKSSGEVFVSRHTREAVSEMMFKDGKAHESPIKDLIFSLNSGRLASVDNGGNLRVWDVSSGAWLQTIEVDGIDMEHLVFSPDGRYLAAASKSGTLFLWDSLNGQVLKEVAMDIGLSMVKFTDNDQTLTIATQTGLIQHIRLPKDLASDETLPRRIISQIPWGYSDGKRSPEDQWIEFSIQVLDTKIAQQNLKKKDPLNEGPLVPNEYSRLIGLALKAYEEPDYYLALKYAFDASESHQMTLEAHTIISRILPNLDSLETTFWKHKDRVEVAVFSPDGKSLLSSDWSGRNILWDVETKEIVQEFDHSAGFAKAFFSPNGKKILTRDFRATKIWNTSSGEKLCDFKGVTRSAAWVSNGQTILGRIPGEGVVKTWGAESCKLINDFSSLLIGMNDPAIVYITAHNTFAAYEGKHLRIIDVETGELLFENETDANNAEAILDVAYVPQQNSLYVLNGEGEIHNVDMSSWEQEYEGTFEGATGLDPAGNSTLLIIDYNDSLGLFDTENFELVKRFNGIEVHTDIAHFPGHIISVSLFGRGVEVFDLDARKSLGTYWLPGTSGFHRQQISPDQKKVTSWSEDGSIRIFDIPSMQNIGIQGYDFLKTDDDASGINYFKYDSDCHDDPQDDKHKVEVGKRFSFQGLCEDETKFKDSQTNTSLKFELRGNKNALTSVDFDTSTESLIIGFADDIQNLFFTTSDDATYLKGHSGPVSAVKILDGKIISGDIFGNVIWRSISDLNSTKSIKLEGGQITHIAHDDVYDRVFIGTYDGAVHLFKANATQSSISLNLGYGEKLTSLWIDDKGGLHTVSEKGLYTEFPFFDYTADEKWKNVIENALIKETENETLR